MTPRDELLVPRDDVDRLLAAWFEADAPSRASDTVADGAVARTIGMRQRPRRLPFGRWPGMQTTLRLPSFVPAFRAAWLLVALAVLIALIWLAVAAGSGHKTPPPFGEARTGLVAFDAGGDIYVANANGKGQRALTSGPRADTAPTFSRDGTRMAFWSANDCHFSNVPTPADCVGPYAVRVIAADGSNPSTIDATVPQFNDPTMSWAPDGQRLVYVRTASDRSQLVVADLEHGTTMAITEPVLDATHPQWAPTGDLIAFTGAVDATNHAIFVVPAGGGAARQLRAPYARGDIDAPVWSLDGKKIAAFAGDVGAHHDIFVLGLDGSDPVNVTRTPDDEFFPAWSNDGTRIAYLEIDNGAADSNPQVNVWVTNADGSGRRKLVTTDIIGLPMSWSPDDRDLLAYNADGTDLDLISVDDSHAQVPVFTVGGIYAVGSIQRLTP